MNNKLLTLLVAALFPLMCFANSNTPAKKTVAKNYNHTDALSWGLLGEVKTVNLTIYDAWPEDDVLVRGDQKTDQSQIMFSFDEAGRITHDPLDNEYVYDKKGNFIRGNSEHSKMTRDSKGRVATFDNVFDEEDYMQWHTVFGYDELGRLSTISLTLWEAMSEDTISYDGSKLWPMMKVLDEFSEGDIYKTKITYRYTKADTQGNWTERECFTTAFHRCEADDEDRGTIEYTYEIEVRTIEYWE